MRGLPTIFTLCALAQRGTPLLQNPSSGTPRRQLKPAAWRPAVSALGVAVLLGCQASWAAPDALIAEGTVTVAGGAALPAMESAALYVTARPDRPDNVPQAVLAGTRGKPPPIATARFAAPLTFPFDFTLGPDSLTEEGRSGAWWAQDDLIVSARLDTDGVAPRTRRTWSAAVSRRRPRAERPVVVGCAIAGSEAHVKETAGAFCIGGRRRTRRGRACARA